MLRMKQEEGNYRVVLIGIEGNTKERKESFCKEISENYNIPFLLLKKIVDRCPVTLKKNLSQTKAKKLAKTLKSFGANVSVEEEENFPTLFLEFQEIAPHRVALESSHLRKTKNGEWYVTGRGKNIFEESLNDVWVLIQIFNDLEDLLTFEEAPIPINPIPSGEAFPFKVVFEGGLSVKKVSIAFKSASGYPIPAIDRRKKREPETLSLPLEESKGIGGEDWEQISREAFVLGAEEISREVTPEAPEEGTDLPLGMLEENGDETEKELATPIEKEPPQTVMLQMVSPPSEESLQLSEEISIKTEVGQEEESLAGADEEKISGGSLLLGPEEISREVTPEAPEEGTDLPLGMLEESGDETEKELATPIEKEPPQTLMLQMVSPPSEESLQLSEEISIKTEVGQEEESLAGIKDFRNSIETYYQKHRDFFSTWFQTYQREDGFQNPLHALLTILVYARFNQLNQSERALENTQRVTRLIVQSNLPLEEIPPLKGTQFFSGEDWRDLFHRALLKLQRVANNILKRDEWNALDLERLIRVIPHMSDKNSRLSTRRMHELIPDVVKIDFSNTPIDIGESLYRVASRLGVVNPHFDYYQGRDSIGDIKIQTFAKSSFPQYPLKIEDPMAWVGRKEEGGHCFPTQPRCEGCLFETFCPRLYLHFNPSGKGMRGR